MRTAFQLAGDVGGAKQIDVGYNGFDQDASLELVAAMKGKSMESISMADCKLGVEGAKAMAELVSVMPSLTQLDVKYNELGEEHGEEGETVLRTAVEGRSGFELKL